ncbi:hypothetical protein CFP56_013276, partial [Quercus suber]
VPKSPTAPESSEKREVLRRRRWRHRVERRGVVVVVDWSMVVRGAFLQILPTSLPKWWSPPHCHSSELLPSYPRPHSSLPFLHFHILPSENPDTQTCPYTIKTIPTSTHSHKPNRMMTVHLESKVEIANEELKQARATEEVALEREQAAK